ncbi:esterase/lipase [Purpureocillium lilacinum]|uniref:Esterase/lipase n=2 Tax=Purpureocillium lilacinum TaxID=33203 RepID=A0A179HI13_PURLI|nr:esterase/lipase [Purpureocillium lilacinum]OAQ90076.1 esterase/lipase [Purpureocillium lilacinum]
MASPHGLVQYIRLKAVTSLLRLLTYVFTRSHFRPSATCKRKEVRIPSREKGRFIKAWIYYPPNYDESGEPRGLVVNWHGGGYIIPNLGMDHAFCERVARDADLLVLDADYQKAPERPFPAAVEDAEDVLRWVESQKRLFDVDRVALSGFSSGGNLALVAASELRRDFKNINARAVYAFYPGVDFNIPAEDRVVPEPIEPLPIWFQRFFTDCYVPRLEDRTSPRASPMHADASSFPALTLLFVCSGDILAPETEALGRKLELAGRSVEVVKVEGVAHGFDKTIKPNLHSPEKTEMTYSKVVESLKAVMRTG